MGALMVKGNSKSADAVIVRDIKILIADKLSDTLNVVFTGDITGVVSFDGSEGTVGAALVVTGGMTHLHPTSAVTLDHKTYRRFRR